MSPGATISAAVEVQSGNGGNAAGSIGWLIATTAPGNNSAGDALFTCVNIPNHSNTTVTSTFNITAPGTAGTYNAYFRSFSNDLCSANRSNPHAHRRGHRPRSERPEWHAQCHAEQRQRNVHECLLAGVPAGQRHRARRRSISAERAVLAVHTDRVLRSDRCGRFGACRAWLDRRRAPSGTSLPSGRLPRRISSIKASSRPERERHAPAPTSFSWTVQAYAHGRLHRRLEHGECHRQRRDPRRRKREPRSVRQWTAQRSSYLHRHPVAERQHQLEPGPLPRG